MKKKFMQIIKNKGLIIKILIRRLKSSNILHIFISFLGTLVCLKLNSVLKRIFCKI